MAHREGERGADCDYNGLEFRSAVEEGAEVGASGSSAHWPFVRRASAAEGASGKHLAPDKLVQALACFARAAVVVKTASCACYSEEGA